jgi:peptide/nickel transport system permease protein
LGGPRLRFVAVRLTVLIACLFIASFVTFAALYLAPGNPIDALSGSKPLPPSAVKVLEERYHLDEPFLAQYGHWLGGVLQGDFGLSIQQREDVSTIIGARMWTTAALVLYASVLIVVFGIGLGVLAGLKSGWIRTSNLVLTSVTASFPSFVAAIGLILLFAVKLQWFPALGVGRDGFWDSLWHLTLPAIALAIVSLGFVARVTAASVQSETNREHVQTAVSRGIPRRHVIRRHILRNASIPITTVTGITIASLIASSAIVEIAFGLNGLGAYLVISARTKDIAVVQGIALVLVLAFVVMSAVVDLLYAWLDPRVSLGSRAQ